VSVLEVTPRDCTTLVILENRERKERMGLANYMIVCQPFSFMMSIQKAS
jgi:hypothetical protein